MSPSKLFFLPADAKQILLLVNPKAGVRSGQTRVDQLEALLKEGGFDVAIHGDIDELAAAAEEGMRGGTLRAVVSAGGDGTVSLVADRTPPGVPIVVLPLGTENLLAKYLEIPSRPDVIARHLETGAAVRLDAGEADGRLFLLMVGCGFDAEVVRRLHQERKGHIHHLSYAKPIFDSIRTYQYPELRVCSSPAGPEQDSEDSDPIAARWVFVVNLPRYAAGLNLMPQAVGTDGLLDVCTFKAGSLLNGLRYLSGVVFGQHQSWQDCVSLQTTELRVESDEPVPYQLDGDPGGFLPVNIRVLPQRLTLVVDESWAEKHGFQATMDSPT